MKEEVLRFGEKKLGFGMITLPNDFVNAPVLVCFNAGLTSREGPYRLNVLICRALAEEGYIAVRVDLSGKGDTPSREGVTNRESVAIDWACIKEQLNALYGDRKFVLMGLCSGADNAIKIAAQDEDVYGLVLLDAKSPQDKNFAKRNFIAKISNIYKWLNLPRNIYRRARLSVGAERDVYEDMSSLRDEPSKIDMYECFQNITARNGKVLAVFTSQAIENYNQEGQFAAALGIDGFEHCCHEIFWPQAGHLYPLQCHRDRLLSYIKEWAGLNVEYFQVGK